MNSSIPKLILVLLFGALFNNCCTLKEQAKEDKIRKSDFNTSISRGMIDVSCSIHEVFEENGNLYCYATIDTVHQYGAGVRPISEAVKYKFELDRNLVTSFDQPDKSVRCLLVNSPQGMDDQIKSTMKIISIKNNFVR